MDQTVTRRYDVGGIMLPQPFKANRLGHVGLYVGDLERAHHFYGVLLGFHATDSLPGIPGTPDPRGRFYTYNSDHHAMVLIDKSVGKLRDDRYESGITVNQISFQVGTLEEVVNAHKLLRGQGANIWRIGRDVPGSNWAVYFLDPDRHTVELFYGMEQVGWDRRSKPIELFRKFATAEEPSLPQPSELDEVLGIEAAADVTTGLRWEDPGAATYNVGGVLLPRPFKVVRGGPLSLFVRDIDAAIAFYTGTIGLALTEETTCDGERVAFLRTGAEHHTIALVPLALRETLGLSGHTTMMAQGLQVGSYAQLRDAVAFLEKHGCRRLDLPAPLHAGIDYVAHFADTDGHIVQLYHHMEQIGWDGAPRPAHLRRQVQQPWPATLDALADSYADRSFQGPLG